MEKTIFTNDIDYSWSESDDCPLSINCNHKINCSRLPISFWTALVGIKKKILPIEILDVFKFSITQSFSCGVLTGVSNEDIFFNKFFWSESKNLNLWNPYRSFIFPENILKSEFDGFVHDGLCKELTNVDYVYDYDGIKLPVFIPENRADSYINNYFMNLISSFKPFGTKNNLRANLARPEVRVSDSAPYSLFVGKDFI